MDIGSSFFHNLNDNTKKTNKTEIICKMSLIEIKIFGVEKR